MRSLKLFALPALALGGALALGSPGASATPLAAGAGLSGIVDAGLVEQAYHRGRPHYRRPPSYARPHYRVYRPYRREVCRIRYRTVRTAYGDYVRRPVRICSRRW